MCDSKKASYPGLLAGVFFARPFLGVSAPHGLYGPLPQLAATA